MKKLLIVLITALTLFCLCGCKHSEDLDMSEPVPNRMTAALNREVLFLRAPEKGLCGYEMYAHVRLGKRK